MAEYANRNIEALDDAGGHYFRHVLAMTEEGLHHKRDIAAELAWRDYEIERLRKQLKQPTTNKSKT